MSISTDLYSRVMDFVRREPGRVAVSSESDQASFEELRDRAESVRAYLRGREGQVSALSAVRGGPWFTAIQLSGLAESALVAPINHESTAYEMSNYLARLGSPDVVFVEPGGARGPALAQLPQGCRLVEVGDVVREIPRDAQATVAPVDGGSARYPQSAVLAQFTSGSTGLPKCVLLGAENFVAHLHNHATYLAWVEGRAVFLPMPQYHAFGNRLAIESLLHGASVHVANLFEPAADIARVCAHECEILASGPTYVRMLMALGTDATHIPSVKSFVLGTAAVEVALIDALRERFAGVTTHVHYGATETIGPVTSLSVGPTDPLPAPGSVGAPLPGVELIVQDGDSDEPHEIRVRSDIVALAQLEAPGQWRTLTDAEGCYATGDIGLLDESGHLVLKGRMSEFIKQGGFRVNPYEIEAVARTNPAVVEAVAVGAPHAILGERIVLYIEAPPEAREGLAANLRERCKQNLAGYKQPQRIVVADSLPRTGSGKPDRPAIRALASGGPGAT